MRYPCLSFARLSTDPTPRRLAAAVMALMLTSGGAFVTESGCFGVAAARAQDRSDERRDAWVESQIVRGMTRIYLEDYAGAERIFDGALKIRPNEAALLASMSQARMGQGDYSSASFYLRRALSIDSTNVSLWRLATSIYGQGGDTRAVVYADRKILSLEPSDIRTTVEFADLLTRLERYSEALTTVDSALTTIGPVLPLLVRRADLLERLGDAPQLEDALRALVSADSLEPDFRMRLAAQLIRREALQNAARVLRELLLMQPDHLPALAALADILDRTGHPEDAAALTARLDSLGSPVTAPNLTPAVTGAGVDDRYAWLRDHPDDVDSWAVLAGRLSSLGRFGEAGEAYRRVVSLEPRRLEAWTAGIDAYIEAKDSETALEMVRDGLALFPGYVPIRLLQVRALIEASRLDEALALARELQGKELDAEQKRTLDALLQRLEVM